jgi:ABC-type branched-subunit amino acid transport system ATPase component
MDPLLHARKITKNFGGFRVLSNCSIRVDPGSITGVIGPNGAGKSTLFSVLVGFIQPDRGEISYRGESICGLHPYQIAQKGMVKTFQIPREFGALTVLENMMVSYPHQKGEALPNIWFNWKGVRSQELQIRKRAETLLEFLKLSDLKNEPARNISGGQKKLLELGRALMLEPHLLMLDEPFAGVNPKLALDLIGMIRELRGLGKTFCIIEHNMGVIMSLADIIYVLSEGEVLISGPPELVQKDKRVLDAYLGMGII